MATTQDYIIAANKAKAAGDREAYEHFHQKVIESYGVRDPTEGMSTGSKFAAGMGQGVVNLGRQAANIVGMKGYGDEQLAEAAGRDRALLDTGAGKVGAFVGETLATAPLGGVAGKLGATAARAANAGKWGSRALRVGTGATAQGAAEGGLTAGPDHRLAGAGYGAAGAAILPRVGTAALRAVGRGVAATPAARRLMREGVDLTPGQMNPNSAIGQLEEVAQSIWGVGPTITRARNRSVADWQGAARRAVLPPGAAPAAAHDVESLYRAYGPAYDNAKGIPVEASIMRNTADTPLRSYPRNKGAIESAVMDRNVYADDKLRGKVYGWLQTKMTALPGKGHAKVQMDSDNLLKLRSDVRSQSRALRQGGSPEAAEQADLLDAAERTITEALESRVTPDVAQLLRATDAQYAQYKMLETAARRAGDKGGGISPMDLSMAVKGATDPGVYARGGGGPLRKLASSGRQVFDSRTPQTGARLATLGIPAALAVKFPILGVPMALAATGAVATKTGRRIAGGATAPQRALLATQRALRKRAGGTISGAANAASAYGAQELRE